jgi:penicillin amidase
MKIIKRVFIALFLLILVVIVLVYGYLLTLKPTLSGEVTLPGLAQPVNVYYDQYGIPHIEAQTEEDAYYALGYVHAQDRLFQMEMLRRAAGGRLAEILGPDLVKVDKFFRTLGLNHFAKAQADKFLRSDTASYQRAAHAYQKGINHYIRTGKTPIEFTIIGIPKEEFKPEDIYLAVGFMSFGFAEGFYADPVLHKIKSELGDEYLKDFAVHTPEDAVRIKNFSGQVRANQDKLISGIQQALEKLPVALWQGSNGWVISGDKSVSGFPMLSNDTHIGFAQPAVWYEAHLEYPGFSFYGHHLAGIPFGLLGNNRFCGFGLTMFENDDVDFFQETVNPNNANQVKFKESWEELTVRTETIRIKGEQDLAFEVKSSRHGPIINGIVENTESIQQPVSVSWQLLMMDNLAPQAAYLLNHASQFSEAQHAVSKFTSPGLNVMYGDTDGNIAWWAAARLPIRPPHTISKLFLDGASGNDEFLGYYDFSKNPQAVNPPWGFVYSANNQPDSVEGVLYPGYYYPRSRAGRIVELLSEDKKYSVDDMKGIVLDVTSHMNAETAHALASILEASPSNNEFSVLIKELKEWNGADDAEAIAPSIFYNLLSQVIYHAMEDELGTTALKSILKTSVPKNSYLPFIRNEQSPWWDDINTPDEIENRTAVVTHAAEHAMELLTSICGKNPESWKWNKIHTLTHPHPLGAVKPLDKFFNVGSFPVGGGNEVLNNLLFELSTDGLFPVVGGPALRKITDFSNLDNGITVSPTGQSGNIMSPHYSDQAEMFVKGEFRAMMMNLEEIKSSTNRVLILKP